MKASEVVQKIKSLLTAEIETDAPLLELAAGVEAEVECGRSGKFTDQDGQTVTFEPEILTRLAGTLDPEESLLKVGHKKITTETPDYGRVTGLRYDGSKDRLLAKVVPTPAGVKKNREEGFRRVSMELAGESLEGPFRFLHLALLAAHKPAISGLTPVALAAKEGENVFVFAEPDEPGELEFYFRDFTAQQRKTAASKGAAMPDGSFPIENEGDLRNAIQAIGRAKDPAAAKAHIKKRAAALGKTGLLPADWKGAAPPLDMAGNVIPEDKENDMDEKLTAQLAEKTAEADRLKSEADRLRKQVSGGAAARAKTFIDGNQKRIPMALIKAGVENGLAALLAKEAETTPIELKFSVADGKDKTKEIVQSPADFVMALLGALPEQVSGREAAETAVDGSEETGEIPENVREFDPAKAPVKFAKSEKHEKIVLKLSEMRKTNPKATYSEAYDVVARER